MNKELYRHPTSEAKNTPPVPSKGMNPRSVTWLSLGCNLFLVILKFCVGFLFSCQALVADAVHTLTDFTTDLAVLWSIRVSNAPADMDHHYGHRRHQSLAALFIVLLIGVAVVFIMYEGLTGLAGGGTHLTSWAPFFTALISIGFKEGLYRITSKVGRRFKDQALLANAWHQRSDAFSSVAVAAGVVFVLVGGPRWHFMDHLVAVALGFVILTVAWKIGRIAIHDLTDRAPAPQVLENVQAILKSHPEIRDFHAVRARTLGGFVEMDFHILVDPHLTVHQGHEIARTVKRQIMQQDESVINVVIHVEPKEQENQA